MFLKPAGEPKMVIVSDNKTANDSTNEDEPHH